MSANTITVPREMAFEAAAFLEAIVKTLGDLGADTNELFNLQDRAYDPLAAELERDSTVKEDGRLRARGDEIAERMSALLDLNLVRRVTALEGKRSEFDARLSVLEEMAGWKQDGSDA